MPKAFSKTEKTKLRAALHRAGLARFAKAGIRATRIDDICRDVGISKGSFYAFYASKEDLFMAIADARDIKHKADLRASLTDTDLGGAELLGQFFDFLMERIDGDQILKILRDTGELSHLSRKVNPELAVENNRRDIEFVVEIATLMREQHNLSHVDFETLAGLMTMMVTLSMQAELIEMNADYSAIVRLLREMFVTRLLKGPSDD